ncbi:MAG: DUF3107 domain-containing protein [Micrococcales bacterium]
MEIRVGIRNSARELVFETNQTASQIEQAVDAALAAGSKTIKLNDDKGRLFIVPADTLAYLEVGVEETRRVGFIA